MSDTAELAVHLAAAAQGADAGRLCDSAAFMNQVEALGPNTAGYVARVADAVRAAVSAEPAYRIGDPQTAAPAEVPPSGEEAPGAPPSRNELLARQATRREQLARDDFDGEITEEDLRIAPPQTVARWVRDGRFTDQGIPPQKARGRR